MTTTDTTIETRHDRRITVDHYDETTVLEIVNTSTGRVLGAGLNPAEARELAAALDPGRGTAGGQWTRYEFARLDIHPLSPAGEVIDQVVAWLNAHHPKPSDDPYSTVLDQAARIHDLKADLADMTRERDAAVARAGKAERERDEAVEACALFQRAMHKWRERAEQAEARTAPAVTRADIEECVYGSRRAGRECDEQGFVPVHVQEAVGQLCDLFGVEAEQAIDPVEEKARSEADRRYSGEPNHAFIEGAVWAARHVLGQEATR